jgi:hypothetical protein
MSSRTCGRPWRHSVQVGTPKKLIKAARWSVAGGILLLSSIFFISHDWVICDQKLAAVGTHPVVKVCHSPSLTDLPVIAILLLVLLLLLPDLSEVGVPGLISLKGKVEQQEAKLGNLEQELTFRTEVQQVAQQAQKVESTVNIQLADTKEALHEFERKSGIVTNYADDNGAVKLSNTQRAELRSQLIDNANALDEVVRRGSSLTELDKAKAREYEKYSGLLKRKIQRRPDDSYFELTRAIGESRQRLNSLNGQADPEKDAYLTEWVEKFAPEIAIIDAARDAVIRSGPITDNKLLEAAKLAEGLLASWKARERERPEARQRP